MQYTNMMRRMRKVDTGVPGFLITPANHGAGVGVWGAGEGGGRRGVRQPLLQSCRDSSSFFNHEFNELGNTRSSQWFQLQKPQLLK